MVTAKGIAITSEYIYDLSELECLSTDEKPTGRLSPSG